MVAAQRTSDFSVGQPELEGRAEGAIAPTPTPQTRPAPDFDLIGSLRGTIEFSPTRAVEVREPSRRRPSILDRLLGRHRAETHAQPESAEPYIAAQPPVVAQPPESTFAPQRTGQEPATAWPMPTPWTERPLESHDWWADTEAEASPSDQMVGASLPIASPSFTTAEPPAAPEPEPEAEPVFFATPEPEPAYSAAPTPLAPPAPLAREPEPQQQPIFAMPPTTADRWPAVNPNLPARPAPDRQDRPAAPWGLGDNVAPPAAYVAAQQIDRTQPGESPLVAALWAESSQMVLDRGSVRVCHHCALPVSTYARFCRRCGTEQV